MPRIYRPLCSLLAVIALALVVFAQVTQACARHRTPRGVVEQAGIPSGYYDAIDGKCGSDLKWALSQITLHHTVFSYGELWYRYEHTDVAPGTDTQVFDYYSPMEYHFTGTGAAPSVANKEHVCPQSWWGGGAISPAYSDLFNVLPSEAGANQAKSNFPLGVVKGTPRYQNRNMKVGASARQQYRGNVFEPCDEYKGDFARIYFYVATTYANAPWGSRETVANTVAFVQQLYPTIQPWLIDLLLQWNAQDPVSEWEVLRNERVFAEQHNRNPFIDYPQLADYIWGADAQTPFPLATAVVNGHAHGRAQ